MPEAQQPPGQQENPWLPPGSEPIVFDTFEGMNTTPTRPGVDDKECYWIDGFMPLGKNNLRTLPGIGASIYESEGGVSIVQFQFVNIGQKPYAIVLHDNGKVEQVDPNGGAEVQILPPATIQNPTQSALGISQWGAEFILLVAEQTNGYWIWDGTNVFTAGTVAPLVELTAAGLNYTSQPTFALRVDGTGSGATFDATLENGTISQINVVNPGTGFSLTDIVNLVITGGGSDDTATAAASVTPDGGVIGVDIIAGGNGYSASAYVTATGGGGSGASFAIQGTNGSVTGIVVLNPGTGYTSAPHIDVVEPAFVTHPGSGFTGQAVMGYGQVSFVSVLTGGSGYVSNPTIEIIGDGQGATFVPIISGGQVTGITLNNPGFGYTTALVRISGGNNAAAGIVSLMPFGVKGTGIETYQSRAWITDSAKLLTSAPESLTDFAASDGGNISKSVDSFLRVAYTLPLQTNGFLYLIADSSINVISGVATTGTTTTFTNQNADPEIGTIWANAIDVFSRNIIFGNPFGVHVSYGGAVAKISDALDGVYNTVLNQSNNYSGFTPSAAKAIIFGRKVWMLLMPIINPVLGVPENKLLMTDGKIWWASSQDTPLTFIQHQEINSVLTAYGTDGKHIYPLFQKPSTGFPKTVQSKLWDRPGSYIVNKTATRLFALANYKSLDQGALVVSVDNEDSPSNVTLTPANLGNVLFPPFAVGQQGGLTGLTIRTNAADMTLVSVTVIDELFNYRG